MIRRALVLFVLLASGYVLLHVMEDRLLYYPERPYDGRPGDFGWPYEDVWLQTSDGLKLHAWWIGDKKLETTVLFFHGNAGNISHRLDRLRLLQPLPARFFFLDYRGYGESEGKPSEKGLYEDADAAYRYLIEKGGLDPKQIVLMGESLGGAVAIDLAAKKPVGKVWVESTFTSLKDLAGVLFPMVPGFLVSRSYDSITKISKIRAPLAVSHGERDDLVPFSMGRKLFDAASEPKQFLPIPTAGHNDLYVEGGEIYRAKLREFLATQTR